MAIVHPEMRAFDQDQGMHKNNRRHMLDILMIIFAHHDEAG